MKITADTVFILELEEDNKVALERLTSATDIEVLQRIEHWKVFIKDLENHFAG